MKGKTCVVTGTTSGIGKETAVALAAAGAHVAIVCRTRDKGARAMAEIRQRSGGEVSLFVADFGSQRAVRALAVRLAAALPRVDVLVNNAGLIMDERVLTEDGLETTFAVNHIGYFLLARLLEPKLCASAPPRVVNVASRAHRAGTIRFDDLIGARGYDGWTAYAQSKLANIVFTYGLALRLAVTGVPPHLRRRRVRRRRRLAARRCRHRRRVSGAGRLGRRARVSALARRLGAPPAYRLERRAERAPAPSRLSGQRPGLRDLAAHVQRGRREHDPLERALPAVPALGLSGEEPRRRGRRLADRLRDARAVLRPERSHDGRGRNHRRPRVSAEVATPDAADPARHARAHDRRRLRAARLALVALGQRHPHARLRWPARLRELRPLRSRLSDRSQGEHGHHVLAQGPRGGRAPGHARSRARDHARPGRARRRGDLLRSRGTGTRAEGARGRPGRQRHRHAAAPAELTLGALPRRARQS